MKDTPNMDGGAGESPDAASDTGIARPILITREEHSISRRDIDPDALKVLYRLARNNYTAYLVGGGVRDLLLGRQPKDFDISTNAKPEQIRTLFRNCILIGRRFRLAHIRYGEKIIETSTFRRTPNSPADPADPEADLFQRDDNLFGSPAEDAFRRDFTVNGLFYDIESFSIIDYVGGMQDLADRRIRCIGDPNIRFREDPVRMVRAVRFASRLGFALDPETEDAIHRHGEELTKASPARLLEEITRLFAFSSGERAVRLLASTGLLRVILPEVAAFLDSPKFDHDTFWNRLRALDNGDTVLPEATPALIFAVLFLDAFKAHLQRDWTFDTTPKLRFDKAHDFLDPLSIRLRFPRKLVDRIVHMYINQNRFSGHDRGKKGSLTNFVTQESFHESLALAEIVLTSENGSQTRLNHWRELLVERIFGHEDGGERQRFEHDRDRDRDRHGRHGRQDRNGGAAASLANSAPEAAALPDAAPAQDEDDMPGRKLSRSARRRRNKRLRRLQGAEVSPSADEAADGFVRAGAPAAAKPATRGAVFGIAPAEEAAAVAAQAAAAEVQSVGAASEPEVKPEGRTRRGRGRKKEGGEKAAEVQAAEVPAVVAATTAPESAAVVPEEGGETSAKRGRGRRGAKTANAPASAGRSGKRGKQTAKADSAPEPAAVDAEPPKPLTAAAFWTAPEPEPKPEKKTRGGKKKSAASASARKKSADKSADPMEKKPLPMDRADEADIPIDWLDEI